MELPPDFSEFFALLDESRAEYLVVGAYALAVHVLISLWINATGLVAFWAMGVRPREVLTIRRAPADDAAGEAM